MLSLDNIFSQTRVVKSYYKFILMIQPNLLDSIDSNFFGEETHWISCVFKKI